MEEKRSFTVPIVAALLLLLPGLYVGAYYATVERRGIFTDDTMSEDWKPKYRIGEVFPATSTIGRCFYPIHQIDRWVRRDYWESVRHLVNESRDVTFSQNPWPDESPPRNGTVDSLP